VPCSPESLAKLDEVLSAIPNSRWKKMFGEVGVYYDEKFVAIFADDDFFVKVTQGWDGGGLDQAPPYPGASLYWLLPRDFWTDGGKLHPILESTAQALPVAKKKK
jgi:hypothetical protein